MKYRINKNKEIFGFELDGSQDHLITEDMVEISLDEIAELNRPTEEQLQAQANVEAKEYLASTDWYVTRFTETGKEIPEEVKIKREEARAII